MALLVCLLLGVTGMGATQTLELAWNHSASHPVSMMALPEGDLVLIGSEFSAQVLALDLSKGNPVWRQRLKGAPWNPPVSQGNLLVFAPNAGSVEALDNKSGRIRWRRPLPGNDLIEAGLTSANPGVLYVTQRGKVAHLDEQGRLLHEGAVKLGDRDLCVFPILRNGRERVVVTRNGWVHRLDERLQPLQPGQGPLSREQLISCQWLPPSTILTLDLGGRLAATELSSKGQLKPRWSRVLIDEPLELFNARGELLTEPTPSRDGKRLAVATSTGLMELDASNGSALWQRDLTPVEPPSYSLDSGLVGLTSSKRLLLLRAGSGETLLSKDLDSTATTPVHFKHDRVTVAVEKQRVLSFRLPGPTPE